MKIKLTGTLDPERKIHAIKGLRAATELGPRRPQRVDEVLDVAMADARRTGRRLEETRKREARAA
jgi:hypothetical protein